MRLYVTTKVDKFMFTQMCEDALELGKTDSVKKWELNILYGMTHQLVHEMIEKGLLKLEWENYDATHDPYYIHARVVVDVPTPPDHPDALSVWQNSLFGQRQLSRLREREQYKDEPMDIETAERIIKEISAAKGGTTE